MPPEIGHSPPLWESVPVPHNPYYKKLLPCIQTKSPMNFYVLLLLVIFNTGNNKISQVCMKLKNTSSCPENEVNVFKKRLDAVLKDMDW